MVNTKTRRKPFRTTNLIPVFPKQFLCLGFVSGAFQIIAKDVSFTNDEESYTYKNTKRQFEMHPFVSPSMSM